MSLITHPQTLAPASSSIALSSPSLLKLHHSFLFAPYGDSLTVAHLTARSSVVVSPDSDAVAAIAVSDSHFHVATSSLLQHVYSFDSTDDDSLHLHTSTDHSNLQSPDQEQPVLIKSFKAPSPVLISAISSKSFIQPLLALGCADGIVRIHDLTAGFCTHVLKGHAGIISALIFYSPPKSSTLSSLYLISASEDASIIIHDLATKSPIRKLAFHTSIIRSLDISPCGRFLLSASRDGIICLWDLLTFKFQSRPVFEQVESAGFLPASFLESTSAPILKDDQLFVYYGGTKCNPRIISFSTSAAGTNDEDASSKVNITLATPIVESETDMIMSMNVYHAKKQLITVTVERDIQFYALTPDLELSQVLYIPTSSDYLSAIFLDSENIVSLNSSHNIRVSKTSEWGAQILRGHTGMVLAVAKFPISPTTGLIRFATTSKDLTCMLWSYDPTSNTVSHVATGKGHTESVGTVFCSQSGRYIATGSQDRTVKIWETSSVANGTMRAILTLSPHAKPINSVCISPNDGLLATTSSTKEIKLFALTSGQPTFTLTGHKRGIWSTRFSPTDKILASGSADGTVRIWSCRDGSCIRTLEVTSSSVLDVRFHNSGLQVLCSTSDGLVKSCSVKKGDVLFTLEDHTDRVWNSDVIPASTASGPEQFLTVSNDKLVVYRDETSQHLDHEFEEKSKNLEMDQELSNLSKSGQSLKAALLALSLDRPKTLLFILKPCLHSSTVVHDFCSAVKWSFVARLLGYIKDWNARNHSHEVAQSVLAAIITRFGDKILDIDHINEVRPLSPPRSQFSPSSLTNQIVFF